MILSVLAYAIVLIFLCLALWEIVWTRAGEYRPRKWAAIAAGGFLAILVWGGIAIFLTAESSDPWKLNGDLFLFGLLAGTPAWILFQATLLRGWQPGKRAVSRPFPLLDAYFLGDNGIRLRRKILNRKNTMEFVLYLCLIIGFTAVWMEIATQLLNAEIHENLRAWFPEELEDMDLAFAVVLILQILLAPFLEEVVYRGYIFEKTIRFLRRPGPRRAQFDPAAVTGIVFTSILWAVQHQGVIHPEWVKWTQVFVVGIVLGVARIRLGLGACIILHLILNLIGGLLVPDALRFVD